MFYNIQSTKKRGVLKPSSMPFSEDKYFFIEVRSLSFELLLLVVLVLFFVFYVCVCVCVCVCQKEGWM